MVFMVTLQLSSGYAQESTENGTPTPVLGTPEPAIQPTPTAAEPTSVGVTEVTFAQLGVPADIELLAPIDHRSFNYEVPYRWQIIGNQSYLELEYNVQHAEPATVENQTVNAIVSVYFNDVLLTAFAPKVGPNNSIRIPISPEALAAPDLGERHPLSFVYLSGDCNLDRERTLFTIKDSSKIHFEYTLSPLEIDLAQFPRPLIQNLFEPESIVLVLPDAYSDADLTAAASVAAAIGHYTYNEANVSLITAGEATPERLADTSAVIIGSPHTNSFLQRLYQSDKLPTFLNQDGSTLLTTDNQLINPGDGVIQEIPSEYSADHVFLIITGANDQAITSAARALSVLAPRYGFAGNLAIVEEFHNLLPTEPAQIDTFTLADFGFEDTTFYGLDNFTTQIRFFVPYNWELTDTPTLTLSYIHAASINQAGSGVMVRLNNKPAGSVPIDTEVFGERSIKIQFAKEDFKPGAFNTLTFDITIDMEFPDCTLPDLDTIWLRLNEASELYLPHTEKTDVTMVPSLQDAFSRLVTRQELSNILFAMPLNPTPVELQGMVEAAMWLGSFSGGPGFAPRVSRAETSAALEQTDTPYHVIAIGRPTGNPFIAQINGLLPQPFMPGEDSLRQTLGNVEYRLPARFNIGLLQALNAPWSSGNAILVATGTNENSVAQAIQTLTGPETYYQLADDLAFINGDNIETFDSQQYMRAALIPGVEAVTPGEGEVVLEEITSTVAIATPVPPTPTPTPIINRAYEVPERSTPSTVVVLALLAVGLVVFGLGVYFTVKKKKDQPDEAQ